MHTAVTVAANSLDAHGSPGRQSLEDIQRPSEAGLGLVSPIATDNIQGSLGCCLGPRASVWFQQFHRQFLRIPAFSMQKQYSQRSTQC